MSDVLLHLSAVDLSGLPAVSLFAALFFLTFVSEDAACIAAGALAARGEASIAVAIGSCFTGIVAGDIGLYWFGRLFGRRVLNFRLLKRLVSENRLAQASVWLNERGASAIFLSRFITGLRLPTYLAAGVLQTDFRKFAFYFVLAAAIWTPIVVGSVAFSGELFDGGVLVVAIFIFLTIRFGMKLTTWKGRRMMIGKLRRMLRWEFWPLWAFYFPVVCYLLLLALKHRSLTVFTCVNPSIPAGGFVGESKNDIYSLISAASENREFMLRHSQIRSKLSTNERIVKAERFMSMNGLAFPVVLKPDAGERGNGVRIVRSSEELRDFVAGSDRDLIVQEFCNGDEISVFYYRRPGEKRGEIYSVTEKVFPTVVGDGRSTLEDLILSDERAVCLATKYFEENIDRLSTIPRDGERIQIIGLGTHSRGAIFLDGEKFRTRDFEDAIDAISRRIHGFNFGRFDIRYSSIEDLQAGRGFKIIELNGVTSESTNIYDPRYSLVDAYRILFRQWSIAFEIGVENKRLGARQVSPAALFSQIFSAFSANSA